MRFDDPNLPNLRAIASALGELRADVVFVGGATAGLLISDPAAESVRATRDVDAVVDVSDARFRAIARELSRRGFVPDADSSVICRWVHRASNVVFDLMPASTHILGFTNRWYVDAVRTATRIELGAGMDIRVVSAPAFVATKFEAFAGRGNGDLLASHDIEDILNIVDGRPELADELVSAPARLRQAAREGFTMLLDHMDFENGLGGMLADPSRADIVAARVRGMAA